MGHGMKQFATLVKLEESLTFVLFIGVFELLLSFAAFYASARIALRCKLDPVSNDANVEAGQDVKSPMSSGRDNKRTWMSSVTFWGVLVVGILDATAAGLDFFMFTNVAKEERSPEVRPAARLSPPLRGTVW